MNWSARRLGRLMLFAVLPAVAQESPSIPVEAPLIKEIVFTGNEVTREHVMRREMVLTEGDLAVPDLVERSRQGIQDLGLFKAVDVVQTAVPGGVRLTVSVIERWFILPVPRADANTDGQKSYGLSLRWYNVAGFNHTLRGTWLKSDKARENQGTSTRYSLGYDMPFIFESIYSLGLRAGYTETPVMEFGGYVESERSAGVSVSRAFSMGPASQGWSASLSLNHRVHDTEGLTAPEPYGRVIAPGVGIGYRNVRDYIYSSEGLAFHTDVSGAGPQTGSDYDYVQWGSSVTRFFLVGNRPHRNLNLLGAVASYHGGPRQFRPNSGVFSLGGSSRMRGYESDSLEGDFFSYGAVEYLHPLFRDWMRGVISAEVATIHDDLDASGELTANVGLGLRFKVTFLVDLELNLGVAAPVDGTDDLRFYASKL